MIYNTIYYTLPSNYHMVEKNCHNNFTMCSKYIVWYYILIIKCIWIFVKIIAIKYLSFVNFIIYLKNILL